MIFLLSWRNRSVHWNDNRKQAREYLKKKEALKTYDINMFLLETERLKDLSGQVEDKLKLTKEELEQASADYDGMKTGI